MLIVIGVLLAVLSIYQQTPEESMASKILAILIGLPATIAVIPLAVSFKHLQSASHIGPLIQIVTTLAAIIVNAA